MTIGHTKIWWEWCSIKVNVISIIRNIRIIILPPCLDVRSLKQIIEESSWLLTIFPLIFASRRFPGLGFIRIIKVKILNKFGRIVKSYCIISFFVFMLANPFDPILKFALVTFSIQNIFYFLLFFVVNNNRRQKLIDLIDQRVYRCFLEKIRMKNIMNFHWLWQLQVNKNTFIPITSKEPSILWSSFLDGRSVVMFLVDNQTLSPIAYMISFRCLSACFDWLSCATTKAFRAKSQVVSIFPEVSKVFCLRICHKY